jgi:hypothetical protein
MRGRRAGGAALAGVAAMAMGMGMGVVATGSAQAKSYGGGRTVASGLDDPWGVARAANGDLIASESGAGDVVRIAPDGTKTVIASGLDEPSGVAVDAAGDVYVADTLDEQILKIAPDGTQTSIGSGWSSPYDVAVDGDGNVYVADTLNDRVVEVTPGGTQTTLASGFDQVFGVAVDGAGDVFATDTSDGTLTEIAPGGTSEKTISSDLVHPIGVAVDGAGNAFVTDPGTDDVTEVATDGTLSTVASGLEYPTGVDLDASGDVFVADDSAGRLVEVPLLDSTATAVSCGPAGPAGRIQTCTATVSDTDTPAATPTGTVDFGFDLPGAIVKHNITTCTLSDGSCSIRVKPTQYGSPGGEAYAYYSGDDTRAASDGSGSITLTGADEAISFGPGVDVQDGEDLWTSVNVQNNGPDDAGMTKVVVTLPPKDSGLKPVDLGGGRVVGRRVIWTLASLASGGTWYRTLQFKAAKHATGTATLTGTATESPDTDPDLSDNSTSVTETFTSSGG